MRAFKGFNKDLTCRGYQYEEGKEFHTERAECCDTGDYGASSATGYEGASSATGDYGASSATGYKGASSVSDPTGVAVAWGHEARAKGCKGAHLILSDWKYVGARYSDGDYMDPYDKESWELTGAKMVVVDGENIKEDTYYRCIEGEIVEVTEDGEIVEE